MDVCGLFIGDATMSYGSLRSSLYRDYEKFPYGMFEGNKNPTAKDYYSKVQEKCQMMRAQQKKGKQSCPFCRENKKRPLVNYMRKREIRQHKESICEEEEEEEQQEGQQNECQAEQQHRSHHHHNLDDDDDDEEDEHHDHEGHSHAGQKGDDNTLAKNCEDKAKPQ